MCLFPPFSEEIESFAENERYLRGIERTGLVGMRETKYEREKGQFLKRGRRVCVWCMVYVCECVCMCARVCERVCVRECVRQEYVSERGGDVVVRCSSADAPRSEEPYRYMYFNHMNLAIKSTITKATAITPAVMKVLLQMRQDFEK